MLLWSQNKYNLISSRNQDQWPVLQIILDYIYFWHQEKCVVPSVPLDVKNKYNLILSRKQDQRPVLQIILDYISFWHLEGLLLTSMSLDAKNKYNLILSIKQDQRTRFSDNIRLYLFLAYNIRWYLFLASKNINVRSKPSRLETAPLLTFS